MPALHMLLATCIAFPCLVRGTAVPPDDTLVQYRSAQSAIDSGHRLAQLATSGNNNLLWYQLTRLSNCTPLNTNVRKEL